VIDYLSANWLWIALVGLMLVMHTRHGGCGGHDGHDHKAEPHDAEHDDVGTDRALSSLPRAQPARVCSRPSEPLPKLDDPPHTGLTPIWFDEFIQVERS